MALLAALVYAASNVLVAVVLAVVISSALDPVVSYLEGRKIPRVLGTLTIFIVVILGLALVLYTVIPLALSELNTLLSGLSAINKPFLGLEAFAEIIRSLNENIGRLANLLISGSASFLDVASKFLGGIILTASVFVLSFYLTIDRDGIGKFLKAILPPASEDRVLDIYFRVRQKIGKWLQGQLFLSLSVGISVFLALWILGIKYSLILGILAGMLELVPYVGPILSGATAFLIAVSQSFYSGIYILILFILIQQLESHLLVPTFMRLTVGLNPPVVLVALLIGGQLFGFIGVILAVPVAVLAQEVINYWSDSKAKRKAVGLGFR